MSAHKPETKKCLQWPNMNCMTHIPSSQQVCTILNILSHDVSKSKIKPLRNILWSVVGKGYVLLIE